jgi:hypothetical protein
MCREMFGVVIGARKPLRLIFDIVDTDAAAGDFSDSASEMHCVDIIPDMLIIDIDVVVDAASAPPRYRRCASPDVCFDEFLDVAGEKACFMRLRPPPPPPMRPAAAAFARPSASRVACLTKTINKIVRS